MVCLKKRFNLKFGENEYVFSSDDCYSIPADIEHSLEIIEYREVLNISFISHVFQNKVIRLKTLLPYFY